MKRDEIEQQVCTCRRELQVLLGIPEYEKLLRELKLRGDGRGCFQMPVHINLQTLMDDLDRILGIFAKPGMSRADWDAMAAGFLELLLVKYELYYERMVQLGRKDEALRAKKQMLAAFERKMAEIEDQGKR